MKFLKTMDEYNAMLEESKTMLVVLDFTATWCPPCRMIGPIFVSIAEETEGAAFYKVDVDEAEDISRECAIQSMPTFQFFKGGKKVYEFSGASEAKLREKVAEYL
mmetsp:Transcript_33049/g.38487  ORF Transcript_33049/g.38487 Transcript_33049/m.38487 type:complete len:105 (+) Transcript_33049:73-387(+)